MDGHAGGSPIVPLTVVVKEEPIEAGSQEVQQSQMPEDEQYTRTVCTPESQENEARSLFSKCVFCSKVFTFSDSAKLLECLHAACAACITNKLSDHTAYADSDIVLDGNVVVCQICNVATQLDNLIENRFHSKFLDDECVSGLEEDTEEEKKCTNCHDNVTATSYCVECEAFICHDCVLAHQKLRIAKDHTIRTRNDASSDTESLKKPEKKLPSHLFCSVHSHEQLSLFCVACEQLTCRDCQLNEHRGHKYKFVNEIATETRAAVTTLLKEVSYKRVLLKSAMKVIEDRQVLIVDKKKTLVQEITQMVVQLTNAINTRGKQLIMRLTEVCDQKQNTLNEKRIALDQLSKLTDHCIQFVTYALEKSSDMELLYSKKSVTGHLQRIKNRRADIPNPEIPVRIHISLEKVPDLIKVISSIGAIVVDGRVYPSPSPSSGTSTPTAPCEPPEKQTPTPTPPEPMPAVVVLQQTPPSPYQTTAITYPPPVSQQLPQPPGYMGHYPHPRTSPQARMPYSIAYNGRSIMMNQRPTQQQVTSSTHPQMLDQLGQNASLRGLLAHNPPPFRSASNVSYRLPPNYRYPAGVATPPRTIPPPTYQPTNAALISGGRVQMNPGNNASGMASKNLMNFALHQQQTARWHTPQAAMVNAYPYYAARQVQAPMQGVPVHNDGYKITLKTQSSPGNNQVGVIVGEIPKSAASADVSAPLGAVSGYAVSSSVPKTPSPVAGKTDEGAAGIDKISKHSLADLMVTIQKLDHNGISVIAEGQKDSAQVDSSTDEAMNMSESDSAKTGASNMTKDDPNEDWCAVCMDGGDAVLCCDKCPKVFHLYCHIPSLKAFPDESETWQCMLCTNVLDCSEDPPGEKRNSGMSARDLRVAQRIVLELYCQYEQSLPFREVVSPEIVDYHRIIKKPIALDVIREKLKPESPNHYTDLKQVMVDLRLMLKNAFEYNPVGSHVYEQARNLEEFVEKLLLKWAPNYAYDYLFFTPDGDEEEEVFPPNKKYRRIIND